MSLDQKTIDDSGPWKDWGKNGISKKEFDGYLAKMNAREANVPLVGKIAPDFTIEHLDAHGKQTGKMFRLSAMFGKPIALVFGSYT